MQEGASVAGSALVGFNSPLSSLSRGSTLDPGDKPDHAENHRQHYDGEPQRRPAFLELVANGELDEGWAADDGTALHFVDGEFHSAVSSRLAAGAYRVTRQGQGAQELRLPVRYLGEPRS